MKTDTDHFAQKAGTYEQSQKRVDNVANIADTIMAHVDLNKAMHIVDFGSGTGLLLERIAPHVGKITAVDISAAMNAKLLEKMPRLACEVDIAQIDLEETTLPQQYDGIISSMAMHHVRDIEKMLCKFNAMLKPGGFIALADLDTEDGSLHSPGTEGVYHNGFDREQMAQQASTAGFTHVSAHSASVIHKEPKDYGVFLLVGFKG